MNYYEKHIFFCVNQRDNGKKCCQNAEALAMRDYAKLRLKALGLAGKNQFRVNQAGCLGRCALGPCVVIYPEGVWYSYANQADVDEIICEHLLKGNRVERLLIDKDGDT